MAVDLEMFSLFRSELELCKLQPSETLAVVSEGDTRQDYARAFMAAGRALGATVFHVNLPPRETMNPLAGNPAAMNALRSADLVIDLMGLLFSAEQNTITGSGTRMLLVVEPFDILRKMMPNPALRRRVEHAAGMLEKARTMRIESAAGTDITYKLSSYPVLAEYGYTDTPGRWDHWPSGFLLTHGNDDGVAGTVVVDRGAIMASMRQYVRDPIHLTVEAGYVVKIEGDGLDAALLRSYIESYDDPRAYAVSHIGWGLNKAAHWHHLAATAGRDQEIGMIGLGYDGNVLFSMGPNSEVGGTNDTLCHLDMPLRGCTLSLDDTVIVRDGVVVVDDNILELEAIAN